ncbi:MAG: SDR family oxidoreductase [Microscillaceae bacterium]|jgi:NAD(P)-dependent dehydrogenase (short-subunit alcohol dehydrogenase family)|nr:SDR family oxidoreductase [Microscillaceae bacterium]
MFELNDKIALVTGASKGIGEAIAWALGKAGATLILSSRKQAALDELSQTFAQAGIKAIGIAANTGNMADLENLVAQIKNQFGGLDILVNNAGTNPQMTPIAEVSLPLYDKIMDVNLKGAFYLSQLVYPLLQSRGGGSIINIASIEGITPSAGLGAYSISKAGMIMLTKVMANEWGKDKIRVNAICPGYIKTKLTEAVWADEQKLQAVLNQQIIQEIGKPQDIAGIALLLASEAGAYFTGSIIQVDGGFTV